MTDFKRLGDIATYINGYAFKPEDRGNEGLPIIRIQDLTGNSYDLGFYNGEYPERIEINDGDVLISWSGSLGVYLWNKGKALLNQHIFKVVFDKAEIDKSYFIYAIQHHLKEMETKTHGATMKHITKKDFDNMLVPYPDMQKQREIAGILSTVDRIIASCQQELTKLDEFVKSRFIELFGDPVKNPMGWKLHRFNSLCENLDSRRRPIPASEREAGINPYYGASGIVDYVADYIFDENILLVSEDGANLLMRSTPIAFSVSGKVWVNNHAHVVRFEKMSMQKYIEVFFSLIDISDHITGSAQPKLNQAKLNAMMFPVPSDERLDAFLRFIEQTDKSKLVVQQSLEKLETLKKSLMQQYFG